MRRGERENEVKRGKREGAQMARMPPNLSTELGDFTSSEIDLNDEEGRGCEIEREEEVKTTDTGR